MLIFSFGGIEIRKIVSFFITLIIIGIVNWGISLVFDFNFIDATIPVGLISIIIFYFSNSTGGYLSDILNVSVQGETGIKIDKEKARFYPSFAFFASIVYFIGAIIATIIYYKEYFINS